MKIRVALTLWSLLAIVLLTSGCGANKEAMERSEVAEELAGTVWQGDYRGTTLTFAFKGDRIVTVQFTGGEQGKMSYAIHGDDIEIAGADESHTFTRVDENTMRGWIDDVEVVLSQQ